MKNVTGIIIAILVCFGLYLGFVIYKRAKFIGNLQVQANFIVKTMNEVYVSDMNYLPCEVNLQRGTDYNMVTIKSAGYDKQMNTNDDIIVSSIDYNKSKIVGRWIGTKTKEGAKGFWEGIRDKSKHE